MHNRMHDRRKTARRKRFGPQAQTALRAIEDRLPEIQKERCKTNEGLVRQILENFKENDLIRDFFQTEHFSKRDRSGIDFVIKKINGTKLGLDVKSSLRNVKKYIEIRRLRQGKNIWNTKCFVVLVRTDHLVNDSSLRKEILKIIERAK